MPAPANDNWANATTLSGTSGTSSSVDLSLATTETGEPLYSSTVFHTAWFKITPASSVLLLLALKPTLTTGTYATIQVYTGTAVNALTPVNAYSPYYANSGDTFRTMSVPVTAGTTYYIQVGLPSASYAGTVQVGWELIAPPANDNWANAQTITDGYFYGPVESVAATYEASEPIPSVLTYAGPDNYQSTWYKFIATLAGTLVLDLSGTIGSYDGLGFNEWAVTTYQGSSLAGLTEVESFDQYSSSIYTFTVSPGTYYIQIDTMSGYVYATVAFSVDFTTSDPFEGGIPAPTVAANDGWFVEITDHNFDVLQTFRPEALHFVKRIRAVEDADWEITSSAINTDGTKAIFREIATNQDAFKPWKHHFFLYRKESSVRTDIMAGPITSTNMAYGRDSIKVAGKDWLHYLDRRQIPFWINADPAPGHMRDFVFGPTVTANVPPLNLSYQVSSRDIARIIDDVLTVVFDRPYSLPITWSLSNIGVAIKFALNLGDTSTVLSIIDGLSEYWPGFDYKVGTAKNFEMWSPYRFGDPDSTANDGPTGGNICWTFGDEFNHPFVDLEYTNSGPQATHLMGLGAGTAAKRVGKTLGAADIQNGFWRIDGSEDFGDQAKNFDITEMRTRKAFIFGAQEVHEIDLTVDTQSVTDFWNTIKVGLAIWIRQDLLLHKIDSAQRILSMEATVDQEWNEEVKFGLNQIYDTSSHYGVEEG